MGTSLKDALLKVGIKPVQPAKAVNERRKVKEKLKTTAEKHQEQRNFCEMCEKIQPDVEHYKHRNPSIDAEWICCQCADENSIQDRFRITSQSDMSIKKMFRRRYGETSRDIEKNKADLFGHRTPSGNHAPRKK